MTVEDVTHRPRRPLSVAALVAELRAVTVDPDRSPELRRAAAERLAQLATATDHTGAPLVPAAHPDRWWGLADPTSNPVRCASRTARCSSPAAAWSSWTAARCSGS